MAYSTANSPFLIVPALAGGFAASVQGGGGAGSSDCGGNLWAYRSTDTAAAVGSTTTAYFSNGHKLGMRKGDIVFITQVSTAYAIPAGGLSIGHVLSVVTSSAAMVQISVLGT